MAYDAVESKIRRGMAGLSMFENIIGPLSQPNDVDLSDLAEVGEDPGSPPSPSPTLHHVVVRRKSATKSTISVLTLWPFRVGEGAMS